MKKIFTILILMLTAIAVNAATYPIYVKGVQVTDANRSDVLGDGTVIYYNTSNLLVFKNANITYSNPIVNITTGMTEEIELKFLGNNVFTSSAGHCIYHQGTGELHLWSDEKNNGTLTLKATKTGYSGIDIVNTANFSMNRLKLTIEAGGYGIGTHNSATTQECLIERSTIDVKGAAGYGALRFKKVTLNECHYVSGYAINGYKSDGSGTMDGTLVTNVKTDIERYDIYIAGTQVTSLNARNILAGDSKNDSKVSFNASTNELALNGVDITSGVSNCIAVNHMNTSTSTKAFKLKLVGANKITHSGKYNALCLALLEDVDSALIYSPDGTGSLDIQSLNSQTSAFRSTDLYKTTFKDCTVNIKVANTSANAIQGDANKYTTFSFVNANVNAESTSGKVLTNCLTLKYYGCFMKAPENGFLTNLHYLSDNATVFTVVKGKDNIPPFLNYGDAVTVAESGPNSVKVKFYEAFDNFTPYKEIKYHVFLHKGATVDGTWIQNYDLDLNVNSSELYTTISNLESNTTYVLRLRVTDSNGNRTFYQDLKFTTAAPTKYGIYVGGTEITSDNQSSLNNGQVSFDPSTYTLTLNNASIANDGNGIYTDKITNKVLRINLIGSNSINSLKSNGMNLQVNTKVISSSNGKLIISAPSGSGVSHLAEFSIADCTVESSGKYGFLSISYSNGLGVKVNNSSVKAHGSVAAYYGYKSQTLVGCYVDTPSNATFNGTTQALSGYVVGSKLCTDIQILPGTAPDKYDIIVSGVNVTSKNASDILGDGKVSYNSSTSTLTLNGATINAPKSEYGIYAGIPITISLKGTNKITTDLDYCIQTNKNATIQSASGTSGVLNCSTTSYAIVPYGNTLTIKNCTINAESSEKYAIWGNAKNGSLVIENATVTAKAALGAITNLKSLTFKSAGIVTPAGGMFNSNGSVTDAGGITVSQVKIAPEEFYAISLGGRLISNLTAADIEGDGCAVYDHSTKTLTLDGYYFSDCDIYGLVIEQDATIVLKGYNSINISESGNAMLVKNAKVTIKGTGSLSLSSKDDEVINLTNSTLTVDNTTLSATLGKYGIYAPNSTVNIKSSTVTFGGKICAAYIGTLAMTDSHISSPEGATFSASNHTFNDQYLNTVYNVTIIPGEADTKAPTLPSDKKIKGESTDSSITLTWNAATDNETAAADLKYEIIYKAKNGSSNSVIIFGDTSYTLVGLDAEEEYTISINVYDSKGNVASYTDLKISTKANAIENILATNPDVKMYSTSGVLVDKNYRGIVIINGKKYMKK